MAKQNIIFLIVDSFRADKFYGTNKTSITPNIDKLIERGTYYSQTISVSDATLMSWSSLFTSKYAFRTGIRSARFNKLDENTITYFQILKNHGYHFYGLLPTLSETIGLFPTFENSDNLYDLSQSMYDGIGKNIIKKLESKSLKEPWFFVIHIMDLHFPLIVPQGFNEQKYGDNSYEKTVSSLDVWIGKILQKIDDKTLLVITADHGSYIKSISIDGKNIDFEENRQTQIVTSKLSKKVPKFLQPVKDKLFFSIENSRQKQKLEILNKLDLKPHQRRALLSGRADRDHYLFDENIRIPLLFVGPNVSKGKIISQQVRSVDIMPTVCELLGIQNPPDIDGKNLLPFMEGKETKEIHAYIESTPLVLSESNDVIGIRTSKFKYFRDKNDPKKRIHLFDLKNDPFEDTNIADSKSDVVSDLESILQDIIKNNPINKEVNDEESLDIENELRKLGYV